MSTGMFLVRQGFHLSCIRLDVGWRYGVAEDTSIRGSDSRLSRGERGIVFSQARE